MSYTVRSLVRRRLNKADGYRLGALFAMAENNPTLGAAVWKAAWVALILTALGVFMMPPGFTSALEIVGTALGIFVVALVGIVVGGPLAEQARDSEGRIQVVR